VHVQVRGRGLGADSPIGARIGIFGGIFNPPHAGHLLAAQEAHWQLELDVVVWVPVRDAPHREMPDDPGAEARFTMTEMTVGVDQRFSVSRIELDREGPSWTIDTLEQLRERSPDDELFLILGGDQAAALPRWREPERVLELSTVAVFERALDRRDEIAARLEGLRGAERVRFLDMPRLDISSTLVRQRAASGRPIRYLVTDKVANFIGSQSLYSASTPAAGAGV
jgi:nicotinate-nucleotide adenylyltransferase